MKYTVTLLPIGAMTWVEPVKESLISVGNTVEPIATSPKRAASMWLLGFVVSMVGVFRLSVIIKLPESGHHCTTWPVSYYGSAKGSKLYDG